MDSLKQFLSENWWKTIVIIFMAGAWWNTVNVNSARLDDLENATQDRYTGTSARYDFAQRDQRMDTLEDNLEKASELIQALAISTARMDEFSRTHSHGGIQ